MTFEVTPQDNCLYFLKIIILRRFSCWLEADTGMQLENLLTLRLVANWGILAFVQLQASIEQIDHLGRWRDKENSVYRELSTLSLPFALDDC